MSFLSVNCSMFIRSSLFLCFIYLPKDKRSYTHQTVTFHSSDKTLNYYGAQTSYATHWWFGTGKSTRLGNACLTQSLLNNRFQSPFINHVMKQWTKFEHFDNVIFDFMACDRFFSLFIFNFFFCRKFMSFWLFWTVDWSYDASDAIQLSQLYNDKIKNTLK